MYKRFVLICIYGCTNYVEIIEGLEDMLNGTLSIDIAYHEMPGFEEYFTNLKPTDNSELYFKIAWQRVFNCSLSGEDLNRKKCTGRCFFVNKKNNTYKEITFSFKTQFVQNFSKFIRFK